MFEQQDARTGEGDVSLVRFLLVYDRPNLSLLRCDRMEDDATALKEYARTEAQFRGRSDIEVVLLGSDSLETMMITHPHYFERPQDLEALLPSLRPG